MTIADLQNKKIAIAGLGTNNKKLAEYLKNQGLGFDVVEWEPLQQLDLRAYDVIFRTPGLPYLSDPIQDAKKGGSIISSQTKLFFDLCPAPIIGVTGTKGKGTTSSLIAKIFETAGRKVWLGGNIGRDPFEFIDQISNDDVVVLELSSFQLQDLEKSPHMAVVLTITSDHLNHHKTLDEYVRAKSNILAFQSTQDFAVLHPSLPDWFKNLGQGQKIFFEPAQAQKFSSQLLGEHNWENIAAAEAVAKIYNLDPEIVKRSIAEFEALPHRLKLIREVEGVSYIDDSYSTNIDPVIAAIAAMKQPTILAIGGYDKGLDFTKVGQAIISSKNIKGLVIFGQVTSKILASISGFNGKVLLGAKNMQDILTQARSIAQSGDTVLFSPGTSSFDMFHNETDRGEQFVAAVNNL